MSVVRSPMHWFLRGTSTAAFHGSVCVLVPVPSAISIPDRRGPPTRTPGLTRRCRRGTRPSGLSPAAARG